VLSWSRVGGVYGEMNRDSCGGSGSSCRSGSST
jgi:hypothetical protein